MATDSAVRIERRMVPGMGWYYFIRRGPDTLGKTRFKTQATRVRAQIEANIAAAESDAPNPNHHPTRKG